MHFILKIQRCLIPYTRLKSTATANTSVTGSQSVQSFGNKDFKQVGRAGSAVQYSLTKLDDLVNWARRVREHTTNNSFRNLCF